MKFDPIRFPEAGPRAEVGNTSGLSAQELLRLGIFETSSSNGPAVTDTSAMQVGTVYACLDKIAGAVSQLPLHDYQLDDAGERQRITPTSPIWWLLNESPSDAWTASAWKAWIVRCVKLRGDQHTEIIRSVTGQVLGLLPHHPDHSRARRVGRRLVYDVWDPQTGKVRGVDQDDMLHFTGFGFDGVSSISAIKWAARNAISNSLAAAGYMSRTLGTGGMPRIAAEFPNKLGKEQADIFRESFRKTYLEDGNGPKLPLVLTEGAKAAVLSISPVDLELIAAAKLDKSTICEVMGVPPIIIGDSEKTSSWGTGVEQITIGWVRFGIQPLVGSWEEELNRKLFRRAGKFLEFSLEALLRGDSKTQSEVFRSALGGPGTGDGYMTINEVRKLKNLPAIAEAWANQPYRAPRDKQPPAAA
jgi:HK97 family phage portal protein